MFCRNCGDVLTDTEVVCRQCGFAIGTGDRYCEQCGTETPAYAVICEVCGKQVEHSPAAQNMAYQTMPQPETRTRTNLSQQQTMKYQQPVFKQQNVYPMPMRSQQMPGVYPIPAEQQQQQQSVYPAPNSRRFRCNKKQKGVYAVLGILFGSMGFHDFYIGKYVQGIIHLGLTFVGALSPISWIWAIIEVIALCSDRNAEDRNGNIVE